MKKYADLIKLFAGIWIVWFLIKDFAVIRNEVISVLKLWSGTLIPSLFPYLVLSGFLTSSEALAPVNKLLFPLRKLFKLSSGGMKIYVCSLFCGYPSGAVCTSELYKSGSISANEAERLICFTNNASPLFLITAVGESILGSAGDGFAIYVIQIISASVIAFSLTFFSERKNTKHNFSNDGTTNGGKSFCDCCQSSVNAILMIGGYAVISTVLATIVILTVKQFFPGYNDGANGIIYGIFEISSALFKLSKINSSDIFPILCALVSWSGLSVILQIKSVLPKKIKTKKLIVSKICQATISFFLGTVYQKTQMTSNFSFPTEHIIKASLIISAILFGVLLSIRMQCLRKRSIPRL